jgi:hypothetical protein
MLRPIGKRRSNEKREFFGPAAVQGMGKSLTMDARAPISADQMEARILEALRSLSTPTVSNAIELFDLRPRHEGFMSPEIRCLFPDLGVMAGHAVTARFAAGQAAANAASR